MSEAPADLPEAAVRRFAEGAFTSGLTVPDFAACLQMGLEPVGFVQGYCVMQWQWYGMGGMGLGGMGLGMGGYGAQYANTGGYSENWPCPHGMVSAEHRAWGQNFEETWVESAWTEGFTSAYDRMVEEAASVGAHGIVGVVDTNQPLADMGVLEFRVQGTAVRVTDGVPPADGRPWTTYLAGQRLAKLVEAGYTPVSIAAAVASVRVWANCITENLTEGSNSMYSMAQPGSEIDQTVKAHSVVRRLARLRVRDQLDHDSLHGAAMTTTERELGQGDAELQCILRGNRVRRFKEFDPMPAPVPTVRLL
jgi:Putative heavy-metal-binding